MKSITLLSAYLFLFSAVALGVASNGFLKATEGFTRLTPIIFCIVTIIGCLFCLSKTMMVIPVGFTYATYGALTIISVTLFGVIKYDQIPNIFAFAGIILIVIGVILLNTFGKIK
jgi:small multidrug resistance pump